MSWVPARFDKQRDLNAKPVVTRVHYEGPHGPATGEAQGGTSGLAKGKGVETGRTRVTGSALPEVEIQSDYGPKDITLRRGIEGHLGTQGLLIVRPRFGLTPAGRTIQFKLDDGRTWILISSGFARCELRRGSIEGAPAFRASRNPELASDATPEEVALAVVCETLVTLYDMTKILGRLTEGL
jgi:hypothetical protein